MSLSSDARVCPGCGLEMPPSDTVAYDGYYNTSAECWDVYSEVLAKEYSTYLHLIVNWLELDAMSHLVGEETARRLTDEDDIYRWVNQRVLADTEKIGAVLETHDLIIDPTPE